MERTRARWVRTLTALVALGLISAAGGLATAQDRAPDSRTRIAVLNLRVDGTDIKAKYAAHLTDSLREVVRRELGADRYLYMSKEKMLEIEGGWECEGEEEQCNLTVARQLRVDLFISGEIMKEGTSYLYTLRLTKVGKGGEVLGVKAGQPVYDKPALKAALRKTAAELAGVLSKGTILLSSIPADSGVVLDKSGHEVCRTPCRFQVAPGEHVVEVVREGYLNYQKRVNVAAGQLLTLSANLESTEGGGDTPEGEKTGSISSDCDKPGYDLAQVRRIIGSGNCVDMEGLLEEFKRCRKTLKRQWRKAQEQCVQTGDGADCAQQPKAKSAYDREVEQYRTLVRRMRKMHCSGAPR